MTARLMKIGDTPPGGGGDFERLAIESLCASLPDNFIIVANLGIPRGDGTFYEIDALVIAPGICKILEMKSIAVEATIYKDRIVGIRDFSFDRVFSKLDYKAKLLRSRLMDRPFPYGSRIQAIWIDSIVVVPDATKLIFKHQPYRDNGNVKTLAEVLKFFRNMDTGIGIEQRREQFEVILNSWKQYVQDWITPTDRTSRTLGQYRIIKEVETQSATHEFHAADTPPCKVEVRLREFQYNPLLGKAELDKYLDSVTKDMQTLRQIRHQYIACVTGHFQTGSSLVEVSDWFDGQSLEESWTELRKLSLFQKTALFIKMSQALGFCHGRGVFHRHICAESIMVDDGFEDIRIIGFQFAKNLALGNTLSLQELEKRDPRLFSPEEIDKGVLNHRLCDIFQAGVLFYRVMENGEWPFASTWEYCKGEQKGIREWCTTYQEPGTTVIHDLIEKMLLPDSSQRIDLFERVEGILSEIK